MESEENMTTWPLTYILATYFFQIHIFHLDFVKGTKGTDEVKRNGLFPIPAAEHNFGAPFFE